MLIEMIEDRDDARLPALARAALGSLVAQLRMTQAQILDLEKQLKAWHRSNEASRRLEAIPGVGVITATALVATIGDATQFHSGRQLAAWLGLVPRLSLLLTPSGAETLVFWVSQPLAWLVAPKDVPLMTRRNDLKLSHGATAKARENAVKQDRVPTCPSHLSRLRQKPWKFASPPDTLSAGLRSSKSPRRLPRTLRRPRGAPHRTPCPPPAGSRPEAEMSGHRFECPTGFSGSSCLAYDLTGATPW